MKETVVQQIKPQYVFSAFINDIFRIDDVILNHVEMN